VPSSPQASRRRRKQQQRDAKRARAPLAQTDVSAEFARELTVLLSYAADRPAEAVEVCALLRMCDMKVVIVVCFLSM
jgi:hypothetical protein